MAFFIGGTLGTVLWIISIICIIWIIYDVLAKNRKLSTVMKVVWVVIALVLNQYSILAAIVYYFMYKK
jgi:O-antigen ligase